jgi:crossover junction endodeoxyribonuclease RuvC
MHRPIRILGIDPGLRRTGWGMVTIDGNRLSFLACGSLTTDSTAGLAARLLAIHDGLRQVVHAHAPDEAAVEATIVNKDASATLKLGQARGIAMLVPAIAGVPVAEYAPNLVKKTIVGAGHGEKAQIRMMIGVLLPAADPKSTDAADALAIAVCHAHHRRSPFLQAAGARSARMASLPSSWPGLSRPSTPFSPAKDVDDRPRVYTRAGRRPDSGAGHDGE